MGFLCLSSTYVYPITKGKSQKFIAVFGKNKYSNSGVNRSNPSFLHRV